ncbi:MAG: molybdenum cofactor guanylyltransferase [Candidatus Accumulibacter sp.]|jgi:molybdopterin-guanine dinucleotide biosynthesis protein A|uniref:molybdenum cofactor guanylyltransferase MobA n=1 Tax=Accumulibacter sp. TaxID=2053492 RepID=UPI001A509547|nr:molybdenum cofactor guanylyltransferase MobA [Accumulibacter sp.]MBL8395518.1 molybdenum cofactor guanylyltransferase [Accumulibacter sp.]
MNGKTVSGVILAGGLGRRMGGVDKGLQMLQGRPLVAWVIERLAPQVGELLINANRNGARYAAFGHALVPDRIPDFAGPLAGLHAALSVARHPLVASVPCDSPFLPTDLVARLLSALAASGAQLAVAHCGARVQPVFCLCHRAVLPSLGEYLAGGGRRIDRWQASMPVVEVRFDDQPEAFANINTGQELRHFAPLSSDFPP